MINLYEKFKGKTIFMTVTNENTAYKGTILSQDENFIEFPTDRYVFYFNINHIARIHVVE